MCGVKNQINVSLWTYYTFMGNIQFFVKHVCSSELVMVIIKHENDAIENTNLHCSVLQLLLVLHVWVFAFRSPTNSDEVFSAAEKEADHWQAECGAHRWWQLKWCCPISVRQGKLFFLSSMQSPSTKVPSCMSQHQQPAANTTISKAITPAHSTALVSKHSFYPTMPSLHR